MEFSFLTINYIEFMPPRKVKVVSMGIEHEPATSTVVVLNDNEDLTPPETVASTIEPPDKPLLDTEEIDQMIQDIKKSQKTEQQEECIHCGKTMSKKSLKYSHSKNCKGLPPPEVVPVIPEPVIPEPAPVIPKTKRAPRKPKVQSENIAAEPITDKAKVFNDLIETQNQTRHQQRQVRI